MVSNGPSDDFEPMPATPARLRRLRGFEPAGGLVKERIRSVGESRGFAVARLVTHWAEVVGPELAAMALPVKIGYGREGLGATLTLLVEGARAPMVDLSRERIRDRVNACYGYNAIARIVLTQTSASGFAEGQAAFAPARQPARPDPGPEIQAQARQAAEGCADAGLRAALEDLGRNVLSRPARRAAKGKAD